MLLVGLGVCVVSLNSISCTWSGILIKLCNLLHETTADQLPGVMATHTHTHTPVLVAMAAGTVFSLRTILSITHLVSTGRCLKGERLRQKKMRCLAHRGFWIHSRAFGKIKTDLWIVPETHASAHTTEYKCLRQRKWIAYAFKMIRPTAQHVLMGTHKVSYKNCRCLRTFVLFPHHVISGVLHDVKIRALWRSRDHLLQGSLQVV